MSIFLDVLSHLGITCSEYQPYKSSLYPPHKVIAISYYYLQLPVNTLVLE